MKKKKSQKDIEKLLLRRFMKIYNNEYNDSIELIMSTEEPDFIINYKGNIIGAEVTEVYKEKGPKGSKKRRAEVFQDKFVNNVKKEFKKSYKIKIIVTFSLNKQAFDKPIKDKNTLKLVADLIYNNLPKNGENIILKDEIFNLELNEIIDEIIISKKKNYEHWTHIEAEFIGPAIEDIKTTIDEKENKYNNYINHEMRPEEIWLVVIATGNHLSSTIDFKRIKSDAFCLNSNFDKIYLFGFVERELLCLKN